MFRKLCVSFFKCFKFRMFSSGYDDKTVGFIGCGSMGTTLIKSLLKHGTRVVCYDTNEEARKRVSQMGAKVAESSAGVGSQTKVIFTILPEYRDLMMVFADKKHGLIRTLQDGSIIVDMSTIGPVNTVRFQDALHDRKVHFLSAPVCGGSRLQAQINVIFVVGGPKNILNKVEHYLHQMSTKTKESQSMVFYMGDDIGSGQSARICILLLVASCMVGTAEVMNMAIRLGLDIKQLTEAMSVSSAQCWAVQYYNPVPNVISNVPSNDQYEGGESISVIVHALAVAQDVANKLHTPIPVSGLASQMFSLALANGYADKDFSVVYKLFKRISNRVI